jgi:hypothetical protein
MAAAGEKPMAIDSDVTGCCRPGAVSERGVGDQARRAESLPAACRFGLRFQEGADIHA